MWCHIGMSAQPNQTRVFNQVLALDGVLKCMLAFVFNPANNTANDPIFEVWGDDDDIRNIRKVSKTFRDMYGPRWHITRLP